MCFDVDFDFWGRVRTLTGARIWGASYGKPPIGTTYYLLHKKIFLTFVVDTLYIHYVPYKVGYVPLFLGGKYMPHGRKTKIIQVIAPLDVVRRTKKLSEMLGLSMSAVACFAISDLADRKGVVLEEEVDPNQLSMDLV